jgi:hypothetical protein
VSAGPLTIIVALVQGVLVPMGIVAAAIVAAARGWETFAAGGRAVAAAFLLLGLCGTLPILISPKQTGHYLMPAVPFYSIAAGTALSPTVARLRKRLCRREAARTIRLATGTLVLGALVAAALPVFEREPARLAQLDRLAAVAPRGATAGICPATNGDWGLHAWFQRRFEMSLDAAQPMAHDWFVQTAEDRTCSPPACRPASDARAALVLLRCDR